MSGRDLVAEMRESGRTPAPRPRGNTLDLVLVVIVVIALGSAGYFGVSSWRSSGPPQPAAPPPVASAAPPAAVAAVAWTPADAARCKAKAREAYNAPLPAEMAIANRAVTEGFSALATNLDCTLSSKIARFCAPAEKAALVAAINDYLGRVDLVQLGLGVQGAPMALMGSLFGGEMAGGSAVYDEEREETLKFMASYHQHIAADLQALARAGIVAPSDFAGPMGGVPKTVAAMFGTAKPQRQLCTAA